MTSRRLRRKSRIHVRHNYITTTTTTHVSEWGALRETDGGELRRPATVFLCVLCDSDGVRDCELRVAGGSETERVRDGDRQGRERERAAPINTQKEELDGGGRRAEEEVEQRKVEVGGARVCGGGRDMYMPVVGLAHDILLPFVPNFRLLLFFSGSTS